MQLVVLAGGRGTRLRDALPEGLPKPMAPIAGRPFLEYLLDQAIEQGVAEVQLLVGYSSEAIIDHFGDSYCGVPISYSAEPVPLGTGGALKAVGPRLADTFLLANGDTFADVSYRGLLDLVDSSLLSMSLARTANVGRYGSVVTKQDVIVGFHEKAAGGSGLVNAGVYGCRRELIAALPESASFSFETDFLEPQLPRLRPHFLVVESEIIDIGTPDSYVFANTLFGS
ncbi:putative D-glycero-D-manno-heptose 1-phosphate guanosyltransferase [uncultured Mycobacterium sp.]|uniref:Putative D-glycero-D-manno-heptose 1-phosphate guanosyltransferase n=1 Tax=uncultured Mycobacterium sp. TaxID=171292 RepID=A0A1Y5PAY8_9MYCO|nr:putative D-glycero-D-manno-heptose 1-phosphate guanosyltransferase [uncultured Mycobacterium sp.]